MLSFAILCNCAPRPETPIEDVAGAVKGLIQQGKVSTSSFLKQGPGGSAEEIAEQKNATLSQIALAWLLAQKSLHCSDPEAQPSCITSKENLGAIDVELTNDDLREIAVGDSWRVDETYLKVGDQWVYLYRFVDKRGKTVESYLSRTRDVTAAKAFFRKALKRHGEPRVITLDGFEATHASLHRMGTNNEFNYRWDNPVQIRTCPYLNNIVEQDYRRVKSRVGPMLGFKRFFNARRVVAGVQLVQKIVKGQFDVPASFGTDPFCVWYNMLAA